MELLSLRAALAPMLQKSDVVAQLVDARASLRPLFEQSLPNVIDILNNKAVELPNLKLLTKFFYMGYGTPSITGKKQQPLLSDVQHNWDNIKANLEFFQTASEDELETKLIAEGLSTRDLVLIRASDHAFFISNYLGKLLDHILILAAAQLLSDESGSEGFHPLLKIEQKWLETNALNFGTAIKAYGQKSDLFAKAFKAMPELFAEAGETLLRTMDQNEIDPLSAFGEVGFSWSPFYHLGMRWDDYQVNQIKKYEEQQRVLELRILVLQNKLANQEDAKTENALLIARRKLEQTEAKLRDLYEP